MSRYDYEQSKEIELMDWPFYALVMAVMRKADSDNMTKMRRAFPDIHRELWLRYEAPGGWLPTDPDWEREAGDNG